MQGQTISHYRILERIGGGGMGVVYKATDVRLDRLAAIKFLPSESTGDEAARRRFVLEAKAASALDHPNICTIHEIDTTPDGQLFIAMALYDGGTLKERIEQGRLELTNALDIAEQIARGLAKAHAAGIIHRDIKPANVMMTKDGVVKLLDFGIAKLLGNEGATQTGALLGTPAYMAPEQLSGEPASQRSDIWSLGAVLYEMLTAQPPFRGDQAWSLMRAILDETPRPLHAFLPDVPEDVVRVVGRALQKSPEARYQSATELATDLREARARLTAGVGDRKQQAWQVVKRPAVAVPTLLALLAAGGIAAWAWSRNAEARWARDVALPEIQRLAEREAYPAAFALAERAARSLPADEPILGAIWSRISLPSSVVTVPAGADAFMKVHGAGDEKWRHLGRTPLDSIRLPRGTLEWRFAKAGFDTIHLVSPNPGVLLRNLAGFSPLAVDLQAVGVTPKGMVYVPGGDYPIRITGFDPRDPVPMGSFFIDRYEVTNRAFQNFVDAGGYDDADYWRDLEFRDNGRALAWTEARQRFRDQTGRTGPATWELGRYADGAGDHPVGGVSWYEAVAYCRWSGKTLPTIYHWARAAMSPGEHISPLLPVLVPRSNFESNGAVAVGSLGGIGPYGTYDMGGNVAEWLWNESEGARRWILGGGWNQPTYMYTVSNSAPPADRSPTNGFRCALFASGEEGQKELSGPVELRTAQGDLKVASDEVFRVFKQRFSYDATPLNARVEARDSSSEGWIGERVTFDAGYDGERMMVYITRPKAGTPPYQVVVAFPGLGPFQNPGGRTDYKTWDFIPKSHRALVQPVFKGSNERWDPLVGLSGEEYLRALRTRIVQWHQDLGRTLDYLATRQEFDPNRVAYLGSSFGASIALPLLAVEPRLKAAILLSGGFPYHDRELPPEADAINYASRVSIPVLMLGGRYDYVFPVATSQRALFERFGTRPADKRHVVLETGHWPLPRAAVIQEAVSWLDRYLGPVK